MKTFTPIFTILFLLVMPVKYGMGQVSDIEEGDQIRLVAPSLSDIKLTGHVIEISTDAIRIARPNSQIPHRLDIPLNSIHSLEKYDGTKRNTGRGALTGAIVGGLGLGLASALSYEPCESDPDDIFDGCLIHFSPGSLFLMGAAAGGVLGTAVGAIIGSTSKRVVWKPVPLSVKMSSNSWDPGGDNITYAPGFKITWSF